MDYYESLKEAAASALQCRHQHGCTHLSAQRRMHHDGSVTWFVIIDDEFCDFAVHLTDDPTEYGTTAESLASYISRVWDEEWDDRQKEHPVGDFSHGSSDW